MLRPSIVIALLLLTTPATPGRSAPPPATRAEPRTHDRGEIVFVEGVVYARTTDDAGRPVALALDAAFPKRGGQAPLPAVVYVHGGRWRTGGRADGAAFTELFARGGYLAVTIDYRLAASAKYPAAVDDVKAAIRFLRANADDLGIDPDRIGVWGHAAGGHLSALAATTAGEPTGFELSSAVACAVSVSGPADLAAEGFSPEARAIVDFWVGGATPELALARARAASPITHVDAGDPPILLVHGTADPLLPMSQPRRFHAALEEAGVESELHVVEGAGHQIEDDGAARRIAAFFDEHLGGAARRALGPEPPTSAPDR